QHPSYLLLFSSPRHTSALHSFPTRRSSDLVLQRLEVPPGRYQIRVAASQPGSATGSVVHDIDVPDFSATLGISSIVLTSHSAAAAATVVGDPDLRTALPDAPGAARTFTAGDVVTLVSEVYDNRDTPGSLLVNVTITTAA